MIAGGLTVVLGLSSMLAAWSLPLSLYVFPSVFFSFCTVSVIWVHAVGGGIQCCIFWAFDFLLVGESSRLLLVCSL